MYNPSSDKVETLYYRYKSNDLHTNRKHVLKIINSCKNICSAPI